MQLIVSVRMTMRQASIGPVRPVTLAHVRLNHLTYFVIDTALRAFLAPAVHVVTQTAPDPVETGAVEEKSERTERAGVPRPVVGSAPPPPPAAPRRIPRRGRGVLCPGKRAAPPRPTTEGLVVGEDITSPALF